MGKKVRRTIGNTLLVAGVALLALLFAGRARPAGISFTTAGSVLVKVTGGYALPSGSGLLVDRLALGPAGSALPTYVGTQKFYCDLNQGAVRVIDMSGNSGALGTDDWTYYGSANIGFRADEVSILGSQARAGAFVSLSAAAAARFPKGLYTDPGYGIKIGASAASEVPTTNALDFEQAGAWTNPTDTGTTRIIANGPTIGVLKITTGFDDLYAGTCNFSGIVQASGYHGAGAVPAPFPHGLYTAANKGIGVGTTAPPFNGIKILKGTNPLVGYADAQMLFCSSVNEHLITTGEAAAVDLTP